MTAPYAFSRQGRSLRAGLVLSAIYATCIAAIVVIDAAWWLMSGLSLLTIPALLDLWFNPASGLRLTDTSLVWFTGRRNGSIDLSDIATARFDTRWDFSVRVTLILADKKRVRLPAESLPPHRDLEAELTRRNVTVDRHHFVIF